MRWCFNLGCFWWLVFCGGWSDCDGIGKVKRVIGKILGNLLIERRVYYVFYVVKIDNCNVMEWLGLWVEYER